jgi:hypothetical protein
MKKLTLKYLIILFVFEILIGILKLTAPLFVQTIELDHVFVLVRAIIFIYLLKECYILRVNFKSILIVVVSYIIVLDFIQVGLGTIFINFCSPENNYDQANLSNLLSNACSFPTSLNLLYYFEIPFIFLKQFFQTYNYGYLVNCFLSPYILYLFLFYKFCLFHLFQQNNKNPYLSFIPIVNKIILLQLCQLPRYWIFFLVIPFVRLFFLFKINKRLIEIQHIENTKPIFLTLFPVVFYGELTFK